MSGEVVPTNDTIVEPSQGWKVSSVHRGSPAEAAGVERGWQLISISGAIPTANQLNLARAGSHPHLSFADEDGRIWKWRGKLFPFGVIVSPPIDSAFRRDVHSGVPDRQLLVNRFANGDLAVFADLVNEFRQGLSGRPGFLSRLGFSRASRAEIVPTSDDYELLGFLGLGYAAAGRFNEALEACNAATEARDRVGQPSYSGNTYAVYHVTALMVAEAQGRSEDAAAHIVEAMDLKPEHPFLRDTYRRIIGKEPPPVEQFPSGTRFRIDYKLPNYDPVRELPSHGYDVGLKSTLAAMDADQLLIIFAMGGYRSNYYANLDIERLALAHRSCLGRIADVHVITSSTYALDAEHRRRAEGLAQTLGLRLTVLWDEDDSVMSKLNYHMSPARFCLDNDGTILSTATFEEERGLWEAIHLLDRRLQSSGER